jgi:hypothetical protein
MKIYNYFNLTITCFILTRGYNLKKNKDSYIFKGGKNAQGNNNKYSSNDYQRKRETPLG